MKPLAIGATRLLIESATARRLQLREEPANDDASRRRALRRADSEMALAGGCRSGCRRVARPSRSSASRLGWWDRFGRLGAKEPIASKPAATAPPAEAVPPPADRLADYRAKAALALEQGRLAEPAGDNALDHYFSILALAPADQGARAGVSAVVENLFTRAEEALLADSLEDRGRGARSRPACRPREQPTRVSRRAARARAGGIGGDGAAGERGTDRPPTLHRRSSTAR